MKQVKQLWGRLRARLLGRPPSDATEDQHYRDPPLPGSTVKIFVVVEGTNDIQFLRRISTILHADDVSVPDLSVMEYRGELIFVPFGGGDLSVWTHRLAGLGRAEWHLYDREVPPETEARQQAARLVNLRPNCRAQLTSKRSLENYLHPQVVCEAGGIDVSFSDEDNVAELVARQRYDRHGYPEPWEELSPRSRKRWRNRVKKWLNTRAVERMTPQLLAERDPQGEVRSWLATIVQLADGCP